MRAWTFQLKRDKEKLGAKKAPWFTGWIDPETGKRRSKKMGAKTAATTYARKLEGEAAAGTYRADNHARGATWAEFLGEFKEKILSAKKEAAHSGTRRAIRLFERICEPHRMKSIKTAMIDEFIAKRRVEKARIPGKKTPSENTVSVATVNANLRHLRAVLKVAHEWGYLQVAPRFKMLKEPTRLPRYVTEEDFARIYEACDIAKRPTEDGQECSPCDWWRALTTFLYLTGWRIRETLALRWDDVSLDNRTAITRAEDNKGGREERIPLHPLAVAHLRTIIAFDGFVFNWPYSERLLWRDFGAIQAAAGIHLVCRKDHVHNAGCHQYGFHDFRRAFATSNARQLGGDALQSLMRHKSYATTKRYINMANQLDDAVQQVHVPAFLKPEQAGNRPQL